MFPKILVKLCFIIDVKLGYKEVFPVSSPEVFFFGILVRGTEGPPAWLGSCHKKF